jgi:hypothetical protein
MLPRRVLLRLLAATVAGPRAALACAPPANGIKPLEFGDDLLLPPYDRVPYRYFELADRHPFEPEAVDCSVVNAWWLAEAATLAYHQAGDIAGRLPPGLEIKAEIEGAGSGVAACDFCGEGETGGPARAARGYIAAGDRFVIVSFTGTEVAEPSRLLLDLLTDFDLRRSTDGSGALVHRGFYRAFQTVCCQVEDSLSRFAGAGQRSVWFTGHSLGAAVATLAAARWRGAGRKALYTFGAPRIGNEDFAAHVIDAVPTYRFVHDRDIVARVPPALPGISYSDIGRDPVYFGNDGRPATPTGLAGTLLELLPEVPSLVQQSPAAAIKIVQASLAHGFSQEAYREVITAVAANAPGFLKDHAPIYYMEYFKRQLA